MHSFTDYMQVNVEDNHCPEWGGVVAASLQQATSGHPMVVVCTNLRVGFHQ